MFLYTNYVFNQIIPFIKSDSSAYVLEKFPRNKIQRINLVPLTEEASFSSINGVKLFNRIVYVHVYGFVTKLKEINDPDVRPVFY